MRNWRTALGLVAVVTVLLAMIMPVPAQDPAVRIVAPAHDATPKAAPAIDLFRGVIAVEGKEVPLPVGEWRLAGRAVSAAGEGGPRNVVSVALVRLHDLAVDAAILIQTNRLDSDAAWGSIGKTQDGFAKPEVIAPGDLIYTGTPAGVGPVAKGDRIEVAIEGLESLVIEIG